MPRPAEPELPAVCVLHGPHARELPVTIRQKTLRLLPLRRTPL